MLTEALEERVVVNRPVDMTGVAAANVWAAEVVRKTSLLENWLIITRVSAVLKVDNIGCDANAPNVAMAEVGVAIVISPTPVELPPSICWLVKVD